MMGACDPSWQQARGPARARDRPPRRVPLPRDGLRTVLPQGPASAGARHRPGAGLGTRAGRRPGTHARAPPLDGRGKLVRRRVRARPAAGGRTPAGAGRASAHARRSVSRQGRRRGARGTGRHPRRRAPRVVAARAGRTLSRGRHDRRARTAAAGARPWPRPSGHPAADRRGRSRFRGPPGPQGRAPRLVPGLDAAGRGGGPRACRSRPTARSRSCWRSWIAARPGAPSSSSATRPSTAARMASWRVPGSSTTPCARRSWSPPRASRARAEPRAVWSRRATSDRRSWRSRASAPRPSSRAAA